MKADGTAYGSSPRNSEDSIVAIIDPNRMGSRRRQMALIVTLIGLATFVTPLMEIDSEVLGRTRWSPLQVIVALHAGGLPIHRPVATDHIFVLLGPEMLFGFGGYFLLTLIAAAIVFSPSARFVGSSSALGAALTLGNGPRWAYFPFQEVIYGTTGAFADGHQVHAGIFCLVLLGVFGLLGFIAVTKQLD